MSSSTVPSPTPKRKSRSTILTLPASEQTLLTQHLHQLNTEALFVFDLNRVLILPTATRPTSTLITSESFVNSLYANRRMGHISVADEWRKWPLRRTVNSIVYEPGKPTITAENNYNEWRPSLIKPAPGDLTLWNRFLTHIFSSDPTYRDWFTAWLAYPLQHPGTKLHSACIFWSVGTATGKSTLGYILKHLYGAHNYTKIGEGDMMGAFNAWAAGKQIAEVEEIRGGAGARKYADNTKSMITQHEIRINEKHKAHYVIRDCINYYFTSNHPNALFLEESDRRFFVHRVTDTPLPSSFFEHELDPWLKSGGFSAILHHLLHDVDLTRPIVGGDPRTPTPAPFAKGSPAPQTSARREMILESMDDAESWARELLAHPDNFAPGRTIFTPRELFYLYTKTHKSDRIGQQGLMRKVRPVLNTLGGGFPVLIEDGKRERLYGTVEEYKKMDNTLLRSVREREVCSGCALVSD